MSMDEFVYPPWPPDPADLVRVKTAELQDGDMVVGPSGWKPGKDGRWWRVTVCQDPDFFEFVDDSGGRSTRITVGVGSNWQQVHCVRPYASVRRKAVMSNGNCPRCGGPAYVGFIDVECHAKGCR